VKRGNHGSAKNSTQTGGETIGRRLDNPIEDRRILLEPLDLGKITSIDDLVRAMAQSAFTGRQLGEAADILEGMALDEDAFVVMTLDGAIGVAGQGLIIAELIDRGIVNAIVSTGALMYHGLVEATEVVSAVLDDWDHNEIMCSYKLNHAVGAYLAKHAQGQRGILKSAYEKGVPVFVPAFSDSELGLDTALNNRLRESTGRHKIRFDPFEDLEHFAATLLRQKKLGIFTIGGGVTRNWSQQFGTFCELRQRRLGENVPLKRYHYGLHISPEPVHRGGSSGSLYTEANSSDKFVPPPEGGKFGEVFLDATVGLPLIAAAVIERLDKAKRGGGSKKPAKALARK
jgi:deoxyhypusine synthase